MFGVSKLNAYLKLMRVDQYAKNIIVLLPLLFSGVPISEWKALPTLLGVLMFCLVSSAVYIMNDIADMENDRNNPAKCDRPLPSRKVSLKVAVALCMALLTISLSVSYLFISWVSAAWIAVYFTINIFYSMGLKDLLGVDVLLIVTGFLIRVRYGTIVADVGTSQWFYLLIAFVVTFTTIGKRLNEKRRARGGPEVRKVLEKCNEGQLSVALYISLIMMNVAYIIWMVDIIPVCETNPLWTIPIMIVFSWKCFVIVENNKTNRDPFPLFVRDPIWIVSLSLLILAIVVTFYVEVRI